VSYHGVSLPRSPSYSLHMTDRGEEEEEEKEDSVFTVTKFLR